MRPCIPDRTRCSLRVATALVALTVNLWAAGIASAQVNAFWKELGGSASGTGISNAPSDRDALDPSVAVGADGRPVVVYTEPPLPTRPADDGPVIVKRWTGSTWETLSGSTGIGHGRAPQVRISSTGTHYVAWVQDDGEPTQPQVHLLRRMASGTTWQPLAGSDDSGGLTMLSGNGVRSFSLALAADGNPIVAFEALAQTGISALDEGIAEGLPQIYVKRFNPSSNAWEYLGSDPLSGGGASNARSILVDAATAYAIHFATSPSLAVRSDGTPLVAFVYGTAYEGPSGPAFIPDNTEIFVTQLANGSAWSALGPAVPQLDDGATAQGGPGGISESSAPSGAPSLATGPLNEVWLAWHDGNNVFARRWTGASWDEVDGSASGAGLSNAGFVNGLPALAITTNHDPIIVWSSQAPGSASQIFVEQGHGTFIEVGPDSAEGDGISASRFGAAAPMIGTPPAGTAGPAVVWMDQVEALPGGNTQIFLRQFSTAAAFRLTVTIAGNGSSVTSSPIGIDCPSDSCGELFPGGQVVVLTPHPAPGALFDKWTGCSSVTDGLCSVTMTANRTVSASFVAAGTLNVTRLGNGAVTVGSTPAGIRCGPGGAPDCAETYRGGTLVTLNAAVPTGTIFGGWGGDCALRGLNLSCPLTITGDRSVTVTSTLRRYTLSLNAVTKAGPSAAGSIDGITPDVDCTLGGGVCTAQVDHGTVVRLQGVAAPDNRFIDWTTSPAGLCNSPTNTSCQFTMTANAGVTGEFRRVTQIVVNTSGSGAAFNRVTFAGDGLAGSSIDCGGDCLGEAFTNSSVVLTARLAVGSNLDPDGGACTWQGPITSSIRTCSFIADGNSQSVSAVFSQQKRTLHVGSQIRGIQAPGTDVLALSNPPGIECGNVHNQCDAVFDYGTTVTLTSFTDANTAFNRWGGCSRVDGSTCLVDLRANVTVVAFFDAARTLALSAEGNGAGRLLTSVTPKLTCTSTNGGGCAVSGKVPTGTSGTPVTVTPRADTGNSFTWLSSDFACAGSNPCTALMSNNHSAAGRFTLNRHGLTVTRQPNGNVTSATPLPDPIDCGASGSDCTSTLDYGTAVDLVASPDTGFVFTRWTGTSSCSQGARATNASCSFTLRGNVTVTPNYRARTVINLSKVGSGKGTVTAAGTLSPPLNCGPTCLGTSSAAFDGHPVTLRATPSVGSSFIAFGNACTSNTSACAFTPTGASQNISATFALQTRSARLTVQGDGSVSLGSGGCDAGSSPCTLQGLFGDTIVLLATPGAGNQLLSWTGCSSTNGSVCRITLTAASAAPVSVTARFSVLLSVARNGDGAGSVTGPGIACGADCFQTYAPGAVVTLTRTVPSGSTFAGWTDACAFRGMNATCSLTMNGNAAVGASFFGPRTLSVNLPGTGTGSVTSIPAGITCPSDCSQGYPFGTVVTLHATATGVSLFDGFQGCDSVPAPDSCGMTLTANRSVDAIFNLPVAVLTIDLNGSGSGAVSTPDGSIDCGLGQTRCAATVPVGSQVTLTPTAATGSFFDRWIGACPTRGGCVVTVDGNRTVGAAFAQAAALTVSFFGNGAGFVDSTGTLPNGSSHCPSGAACTVFFEPGTSTILSPTTTSGIFGEWGGDCANAPRNASCVVSISGNRSVSVSFLADPVVAHVLGDQYIGIGASAAGRDTFCDQPCDRFLERGTEITFEALPRPGKIFTGWSSDCAGFGNSSCVLQMTGDKTVGTTVFIESFLVTVGVGSLRNGLGSVSVNGANCDTGCTLLLAPGDTLTVGATIFTDGGVVIFGGACIGQDSPCTLTVDQDLEVEVTLDGGPCGDLSTGC